MRILWATELLFASLFLYFLATQIILPLWRNTPLLPWLEKEKTLRGDLRQANQTVVETKLQRDIKLTKKNAKSIKASTKKGRQYES